MRKQYKPFCLAVCFLLMQACATIQAEDLSKRLYVFDVVVMESWRLAGGGYHGLRVELKRRVGGTVSPAQKDWIEWLTAQGYLAIVCRGWEEARDRLVEYLSLEESNATAG